MRLGLVAAAIAAVAIVGAVIVLQSSPPAPQALPAVVENAPPVKVREVLSRNTPAAQSRAVAAHQTVLVTEPTSGGSVSIEVTVTVEFNVLTFFYLVTNQSYNPPMGNGLGGLTVPNPDNANPGTVPLPAGGWFHIDSSGVLSWDVANSPGLQPGNSVTFNFSLSADEWEPGEAGVGQIRSWTFGNPPNFPMPVGVTSVALIGPRRKAAATQPPTASAATSTPLICAGGTARLSGAASHDNDENGASIVEWTWRFDNMTTPADDAFTVTKTTAALDQMLNVAGEYLVTLTVKDDEGEISPPDTSSESHVTLKVVGVTFDPNPVLILQDATVIVSAQIVPSSAANELSFAIEDPTIAPILTTSFNPGLVKITLRGDGVGATTLSALAGTGGDGVLCAEDDVKVVGKNVDAETIVVLDKEGDNITPKPKKISLGATAEDRYLVSLINSGNGRVKVYDSENGNNEVILPATLPGAKDLWIKGTQASSTVNDVRLIQGDGVYKFGITVLWVDWSIRKNKGEKISEDDEGRLSMLNLRGTDNLGPLGDNAEWRKSGLTSTVELVGKVSPADFKKNIFIDRVVKDSNSWVFDPAAPTATADAACGGCSPDLTDESIDYFKDEDPQSGGSAGKIYDIDSPGIPKNVLKEVVKKDQGICFRAKFIERAYFEGDQCSSDFHWWSARAAKKSGAESFTSIKVIPQDNDSGEGDVFEGSGIDGKKPKFFVELQADPKEVNFKLGEKIKLKLSVKGDNPQPEFVADFLLEWTGRPLLIGDPSQRKFRERELIHEVTITDAILKATSHEQTPHVTFFVTVTQKGNTAPLRACARARIKPLLPPIAVVNVPVITHDRFTANSQGSTAQAPKTIVSRRWYITFYDQRGNAMEDRPFHGLTEDQVNAGVKWFKAQGTGSDAAQAVVRVKVIDSEGGWDIQKKVIVRPPR